MLSILLDAVLPVFVIASIGILIGRVFKPDPRPISRLALYVFSPALIFGSLSSADIPFRDVITIFAFLFLWTGVLYVISWGVAWQTKIQGKARNAFLLSTLFSNAVNYGMPLALFSFGQPGLERALLFLAPTAVLSGTLAVYIASGGNGVKGWRSVLPVFRVPMLYATVAGLALNPLNVTFPNVIGRPLELLGDAAIPTMIMVLGIQLSHATLKEDFVPGVIATVVRLIISPAVAFPLTLLLGMHGVTQQTVIVLAAMPTAVFTTILATEFDARPNQVTTTVALSTACSMATLTVLIWVVQRLL